MQKTYTIPTQNLPAFEKRVAKLQKAADKVGAALLVRYGAESTVEKDQGFGRKLVYTVREVEVVGETPRLNGWTFVATLQHTPEGVILRTVPGQALGAFYTARNNAATLALCDYCGVKRNRKDTYVVRNGEANDERIVGSNCLADFLGHKDPHAVAKYAEALGAFEEGAWGSGGEVRGEPAVDIETFLAWANAQVRETGFYVSRARSEESGLPATGPRAWWNMEDAATKPEWKGPRPNAGDLAFARETLAWVEGVEPSADDEYLHNLTVACASGYVTRRTCTLVASALAAYNRVLRSSVALATQSAPAEPAGVWYGAIGEKVEVQVKVAEVRTIQSAFGEKLLAVLEDAQGRVFKTFTQSRTLGLTVGEWVALKATVKAHEVYRGRRETVLLRPRIAA